MRIETGRLKAITTTRKYQNDKIDINVQKYRKRINSTIEKWLLKFDTMKLPD